MGKGGRMRLRAFGDEGRTYRRSTCEVWKINLPLTPPIIVMRAISSRTLSASPDRRQPADAALQPAWGAGWLPFSPACAVVIVSALYYLRLSLRLGVMMLALLLLCLGVGAWVASLSTAAWLSVGIGGFVIGWLFQFVGHFWEGRKPAFMDDVTG